MRFVRTAIIAGVAAATLAGAAFAAPDDRQMMLVAHPDGTVEHIPIQQVRFVSVPVAPADLFAAAFGPDTTFAEMDRMAAAMEARSAAMMRQAATMPAEQRRGIVMTNTQGQPVGVVHYSYISSSTDANGCTRTIRYSSDGAADQPRVIRTSTGDCGAGASPAPATKPATRLPGRVIPTTVKPAPKPAARIIPVSAPRPYEVFTPSRT